MKTPVWDDDCAEFEQRFPAAGLKADWDARQAAGPRIVVPWAEKYDAAEDAMRASGCWPAEGQPLKFRHCGEGVFEQERKVAEWRKVIARAWRPPTLPTCITVRTELRMSVMSCRLF